LANAAQGKPPQPKRQTEAQFWAMARCVDALVNSPANQPKKTAKPAARKKDAS